MMSPQLEYLIQNGLDLSVMYLAAIFCGSLLGYERQRRGKPVGILTATLVSLGSTIFVHGGSLLISGSALEGDPTRLSSMIVSGIGFIGAGAIMRSKFDVTGLASAATIWSLGGLGILIGSGHVLLALVLALIMFSLLRLIPMLEHMLFRQRHCVHADVIVQRDNLDGVMEFLLENQLAAFPSQIRRKDDHVVLTINECGIESRPQILGPLREVEGVLEVVDHRSHPKPGKRGRP